MKISKQDLIDMYACDCLVNRFTKQTGNNNDPVDIVSLIGGENTYSDLLWIAGELLEIDKIAKLSLDVAMINIELIKPYTDKYDLIFDSLSNHKGERLDHIAYLVSLASDLCYEDRNACSSCYAIDDAIRSFESEVADDAAFYAGNTLNFAIGASSDCRHKINNLLIKLFEGEL